MTFLIIRNNIHSAEVLIIEKDIKVIKNSIYIYLNHSFQKIKNDEYISKIYPSANNISFYNKEGIMFIVISNCNYHNIENNGKTNFTAFSDNIKDLFTTKSIQSKVITKNYNSKHYSNTPVEYDNKCSEIIIDKNMSDARGGTGIGIGIELILQLKEYYDYFQDLKEIKMFLPGMEIIVKGYITKKINSTNKDEDNL